MQSHLVGDSHKQAAPMSIAELVKHTEVQHTAEVVEQVEPHDYRRLEQTYSYSYHHENTAVGDENTPVGAENSMAVPVVR